MRTIDNLKDEALKFWTRTGDKIVEQEFIDWLKQTAIDDIKELTRRYKTNDELVRAWGKIEYIKKKFEITEEDLNGKT